MEFFTCLTLSFRARKKWDSFRILCQVLPAGQEPKLQMLGPGGFLGKFKSSANKGKSFPHYQKEALGCSWAQAGEM